MPYSYTLILFTPLPDPSSTLRRNALSTTKRIANTTIFSSSQKAPKKLRTDAKKETYRDIYLHHLKKQVDLATVAGATIELKGTTPELLTWSSKANNRGAGLAFLENKAARLDSLEWSAQAKRSSDVDAKQGTGTRSKDHIAAQGSTRHNESPKTHDGTSEYDSEEESESGSDTLHEETDGATDDESAATHGEESDIGTVEYAVRIGKNSSNSNTETRRRRHSRRRRRAKEFESASTR